MRIPGANRDRPLIGKSQGFYKRPERPKTAVTPVAFAEEGEKHPKRMPHEDQPSWRARARSFAKRNKIKFSRVFPRNQSKPVRGSIPRHYDGLMNYLSDLRTKFIGMGLQEQPKSKVTERGEELKIKKSFVKMLAGVLDYIQELSLSDNQKQRIADFCVKIADRFNLPLTEATS